MVTPFLQQFIPGLAGFNALGPGIVMGVMILPILHPSAKTPSTQFLRAFAKALTRSDRRSFQRSFKWSCRRRFQVSPPP
jgi:phosphate transport system permease protein